MSENLLDRIEFTPADPRRDFEYAYGLAKRTMGWCVEELNGSWPDEWQRRFFVKAFDNPGTQLVLGSGKPVGCFCINEQEHGVVMLQRMYLEPEFQGLGIGKMIMGMALQRAHELRRPLELSVLVNNDPAIEAYMKCGFRIFGTARDGWVREYCMRHKDTELYVKNGRGAVPSP